MTKSQTKGARFGLAILGAGLLFGAPAAAQAAVQESPTDALSRHLKSLAANPQSLASLMGAGQSALALGDSQAALTFFGRAEELSPRDGRIKMWIGSALVHLQQPEGALKFFDQAVSLGTPEAQVAGERGLAHDVSGDARRAQRDYRLALQARKDPEVTRRLALSLAISGEREPALRLLDDQLRMRDPAAERTRALVLALTGDSAGAARSVQAAMPGRAAALTPFLERLPALNASERALAVHFGVFPQSGRSAGPLPNTYAAADPLAAGAADPRQAGLGRTPDPRPRSNVQIASRQPPKPAPSTSPPSSGTKAADRPTWSSASRNIAGVQRPAAEPVASQPSVAVAAKAPQPNQAAPAAGTAGQQLARAQVPSLQRPLAQPPSTPTSTPSSSGQSPSAQPSPPPAEQLAVQSPTVTVAPAQQPGQAAASLAQSAPQQTGAASPTGAAVSPVELAQSSVPSFSIAADASGSAPAPADSGAGASEPGRSSRLAEVAATIAALPDNAPVKPTATPQVAATRDKIPATPEKRAVTTKPTPAKVAPGKGEKASAAIKVPASAEKATASAKVPAKKGTAEAAKKTPAAPAEPSRVWVQVAGGAEKAALPREFARLKTKAPKLLAARSAWTVPAKASNRLLVGPFKTEKDAQEFVNELAKSKLDGFAWTSEAGQKIEKLPAK